jgi:hypothetical protein
MSEEMVSLSQAIPRGVLKEWQQDLDAFTEQVTEGLPEDKADQIRSVAYLAGSLIQEIFLLRRQHQSQIQIRKNLHRQVVRLEKIVGGYIEPEDRQENPMAEQASGFELR